MKAKNIPYTFTQLVLLVATFLLFSASSPCPAQVIGRGGSVRQNESLLSTEDVLKGVATSTWFVLASGISSIISVLIPLYNTEVKPLSFSVYRTLAWKRVLCISFGFGATVAAGVGFYYQQPPPGVPILREFYSLLHGIDPNALQYEEDGTSAWVLVLVIGLATAWTGYLIDPLELVQKKVFEQRNVLQHSRQREVEQLNYNVSFEELTEPQRAIYTDLIQFYSSLETRMLDILLGPSLPSLNEPYRTSLSKVNMQGARIIHDAKIDAQARRRAQEEREAAHKHSFFSMFAGFLSTFNQEAPSSQSSQDAQSPNLTQHPPQESLNSRDRALFEAVESLGGVPLVPEERTDFWEGVARTVRNKLGIEKFNAATAKRRWSHVKKLEVPLAGSTSQQENVE